MFSELCLLAVFRTKSPVQSPLESVERCPLTSLRFGSGPKSLPIQKLENRLQILSCMCWASWACSEVLRRAPHTHGSTLQMNLLSLSAHGSLSSSKSVKQIMLPVIGFSVLTRFGSSQRCYLQDVTIPLVVPKDTKLVFFNNEN